MKKSRFTETQIVKAIKAHEGGRKVEEICREMEVTPTTFYKWKQRYGGMEASEVKKLKELQEENSRLNVSSPENWASQKFTFHPISEDK